MLAVELCAFAGDLGRSPKKILIIFDQRSPQSQIQRVSQTLGATCDGLPSCDPKLLPGGFGNGLVTVLGSLINFRFGLDFGLSFSLGLFVAFTLDLL